MAELHAYTFGPATGSPVLALHGVTGHGLRWDRLAREGLPDHAVLGVDLRGHGRSPWEPPWGIEQHVEDLLDTLDAHRLQRVAVMGHSFGGLLATHLAQRAPDRVARVVLLDPAIALDAAANAQRADDARQPPSWASLDEAIAARRELRPPHAYADSDADVRAHAAQSPDGRVRFRYAPAAAICAWSEMTRPRAALAGLDLPTLLVRAGQEEFVSDALLAGLREDLGTALRVETLDTSHMLYWDAFEDTAALVRGFLQ